MCVSASSVEPCSTTLHWQLVFSFAGLTSPTLLPTGQTLVPAELTKPSASLSGHKAASVMEELGWKVLH